MIINETRSIRKLIGSFLGIILTSILISLVIYPFIRSTRDGGNLSNNNLVNNQEEFELKVEPRPSAHYSVLSVTDGDTIRIDYNGVSTPVRLIGVDTPETVDPRTTVQCFGEESTNYLKTKLTNKKVAIESDSTQADRDKYDRLLRYVYLDGEDISLSIIANGYGHEYTYAVPYKKQSEYQAAERIAESQSLGLWSPAACSGGAGQPTSLSAPTTPQQNASVTPTPVATPPEESETATCLIKGNINNKGVKIYHVPGQEYYEETVITPSKGERYYCTEQEAVNAGWRKAKK